MTPFENYVFDSARQNAFNLSQSKDKPKFITVYVEGIEDKSFWFHILNPHLKPLEFRCFSNSALRTGKKGLNEHFDKAGDWLIICRDSDYDYLFPEHSETAKGLKKRGIFQTYTYSIENLKCYADSLHAVCTDVTHNPSEKINFTTFFENYSKIIYTLFIWHLYFYKEHQEHEFAIEEFCEIVKIPTKFNFLRIKHEVFESLKKRVETKKNELGQKFPENVAEITHLSNQLKAFGLEDKNTYLFIQGHALYDNVALPLLRVICDYAQTDSLKEINQSKADSDRKKQVRNEYLNLINNPTDDSEKIECPQCGEVIDNSKNKKIDRLELILSINKGFTKSTPFSKITEDIKNYNLERELGKV